MNLKKVSELTDAELAAAHKAAAVEAARKRAAVAAHNQRLDMINYIKKELGSEVDVDVLQVENVEVSKP